MFKPKDKPALTYEEKIEPKIKQEAVRQWDELLSVGSPTTTLWENLERAIDITRGGIPARSSLPVLNNALIAVDGGGKFLTLSTTNLEYGVSVRIKANCPLSWSCTVPHKNLWDLKDKLSYGNPLTLTYQESSQTVDLTVGDYHQTLKGISAGDFPALPTLGEPIALLDGGQFKRAADYAVSSASKKDDRPALCGVHTRIGNGEIQFTSSDGYALHRATIRGETPGEEKSFLIPAATLSKIAKILKPVEKKSKRQAEQWPIITIYDQGEERNQIGFSIDGQIDILSQLIDAPFPEGIEEIINAPLVWSFTVNGVELGKAIHRAAIFNPDSLHLNSDFFPDYSLSIYGESAALGDVKTVLTVSYPYQPPNRSIELNPKLVKDAVDKIATLDKKGDLTVRFGRNDQPIAVEANVAGVKLAALVYPMVVKESKRPTYTYADLGQPEPTPDYSRPYERPKTLEEIRAGYEAVTREELKTLSREISLEAEVAFLDRERRHDWITSSYGHYNEEKLLPEYYAWYLYLGKHPSEIVWGVSKPVARLSHDDGKVHGGPCQGQTRAKVVA